MMMKHQKGAALIVVLSLLTVSLMVGLSSMQSSQIDERLAGNYKAQTEAQMAAEKAVAVGLSFFDGLWENEFESKDIGEIVGLLAPAQGFKYEDFFSKTDWHNYFYYSDNDVNCPNSEFCGYSISYIESGNGAGLREGVYVVGIAGVGGAVSAPVMARVNIGLIPVSDLDPLTITSDLYNFDAPSGNRFKMRREGDGNVGTSISVSRESDVESVVDAITGNPDRSENYASDTDGEFAAYKEGGYPIFSDAKSLQRLVENIIDNSGGDFDALAELGTPESPKITYVRPESGTYSYSESTEKSGVLIVDGNFSWNGNNTFEGLVVVLGQTFTYNGGGGGSIKGAVVHASVAGLPEEREGDWSFGVGLASATSNLNGGGDSAFVHTIGVLDTVAKMLEPVSDGAIDTIDMKKSENFEIASWN